MSICDTARMISFEQKAFGPNDLVNNFTQIIVNSIEFIRKVGALNFLCSFGELSVDVQIFFGGLLSSPSFQQDWWNYRAFWRAFRMRVTAPAWYYFSLNWLNWFIPHKLT